MDDRSRNTSVKLSFFRLLAITTFSFALTLVLNTLEPAVLGHKVLELVPNQRNTALGFTTFAGLIVAILVQPIVGVFSDCTQSRLGRRLPYFIAGTVMVIACLYLIALAPVFGLVVLGILLIQVASNTVQGPWQALIPDLVPEAQRGRASGLKAMLDILAFVVGRQVAGQLVGRYPQWGESAILIAVSVPVVVYLLALAVSAVWAREPPEAAAQAPQRSMREAITSTFSVDFRAHPAFGWWFVNRMLFWAAFIALSTFLLFFMIDVVGMVEADAQKYVGTLSTLLGAALVVVTLPSGWVADRVGRKPVVVASGVVAALGAGIILLSREINLITVGGVVVGLGVGVFMSANWALVTDIVPREEAARYLGIANIATAGGSAVARFLGGVLIDPLNRMFASTSAGYFTVYAIAAGFFLLSALVVIPLPSAQPEKQKAGG
jgi:MFS family permease